MYLLHMYFGQCVKRSIKMNKNMTLVKGIGEDFGVRHGKEFQNE